MVIPGCDNTSLAALTEEEWSREGEPFAKGSVKEEEKGREEEEAEEEEDEENIGRVVEGESAVKKRALVPDARSDCTNR